jgi:hypothetical protein
MGVTRKSALSMRNTSRCSALGREHPVGLEAAPANEIIDEDADVRLVPVQDQPLQARGRIAPR